MKKLFFSSFILLFTLISYSQTDKPKLVVGIVVDQMRQEYIYRFGDRFGDDGFKKIISNGFMFKNAHINYVPTYTAPGHASIYTGTTPAMHGIMGNAWYDRDSGRMRYCSGDSTENSVGSNSDMGRMSPRNMLTTTIADELRLSNQKRSKSIGISLKDRGAIFPAGHLGEAYWYDSEIGNFITSTYYADKLPDWVNKFNNKKRADHYLKQKWETLYDISSYTASGSDKNTYESIFKGMEAADFPYDLSKFKGNYGMIPEMPFGNDILTEITLAALDGENLGNSGYTDFLAVSFSATDYIGHQFGPNSVEVEDAYLRLDKNIATIISALDTKVGPGNYIIFLTADHAVADVPQFLIDNKIPAGYFSQNDLKRKLTEALGVKYGEGKWVESISNIQVFLNRNLIREKKLELDQMQDFVARYISQFEGVLESYPAHVVNLIDYNAGGMKGMLARGYSQRRSGDVLFSFEPGWYASSYTTGTKHHSGFTYDTHVPMLWYGAGIKHGESVKYHSVTDIVPTLSMMLNIKIPNGVTGQPIEELLEK